MLEGLCVPGGVGTQPKQSLQKAFQGTVPHAWGFQPPPAELCFFRVPGLCPLAQPQISGLEAAQHPRWDEDQRSQQGSPSRAAGWDGDRP